MRFYCVHLPAVIARITVHLCPVGGDQCDFLCTALEATPLSHTADLDFVPSDSVSVPLSNYLVPPPNLFFSVHLRLLLGSTHS